MWPESVEMPCWPWYRGCAVTRAPGAAGCMIWARFWLLEAAELAAAATVAG